MPVDTSDRAAPGTCHRRRRWWQHIVRTVMVLLVVLVGAYVTMPWWLPTGYLRRWMSEAITEQTGLKVDCHSLTISWSDDIEIRRLVLKEPEGFDPGEMIFIERLRCDFSPLEMFVFKRMEWMSLEGLRVHIKFDKKGKANIAALRQMKPEVQTKRIHVIDGIAHVALPGLPAGQKLNINNVEYLAGRDGGPGRITMAAMLEQSPRGAPVSLHLSVGQGGEDAARFQFTDVDLAQLPLRKIIPSLPMKTLSGTAAGALDLSLAPHQEGHLPFKVDLSIRNLEVQPVEGPQLPVVAQAGLSLQAVYQLSGLLAIDSVQVALPGIELRGHGQLATPAGGSWKSIETFTVEEGTIHPTRLVALITGKPGPIGDLTVNGPVKLRNLRIKHAWPIANISGSIDATQAEVRRGKDLLKPKARRMQLSVTGQLDHRTTALKLQRGTVHLGGNTLGIHGQLASLSETIKLWTGPKRPATTQAAVRDLLAADLSGQYDLTDVEALTALAGTRGKEFNQVILDGRITGRWALGSGPRGLRLTADMDEKTLCTIAKRFVKPAGKAMHVDLLATLEPDASSVHDLDINMVCGSARLNLEDVTVRPMTGRDGGWDVAARLEARDLHSLLTWVPDRPGWLRNVRGHAAAACRMQVRPEGGGISGIWQVTNADITAALSADSAPAHIRGRARFEADVLLAADSAQGTFACDAGGLAVDIGDREPRHKSALVPARARLVAKVTRRTDSLHVLAESLELILGNSSLQASGSAELLGPAKDAPDGAWCLGSHSLHASAAVSIDPPLLAMLGELRKPVASAGLAGRAEAAIALRGDGPQSRITARLDTTALAATSLPRGLKKPAGVPARMELVAGTADRKLFDITSLTGTVGKIAVRGKGRLRVTAAKDGWPRIDCPQGRAQVIVDDLASLEVMAPKLRRHVLTGRLAVEGQWQGAGPRVPTLNFTADNVSARFQGKTVRVHGSGEVTNAVLTPGKISVGRIYTGGLDLRAGKNVFRVVLDLKDLPYKTAGTFNIHSTHLDVPDLTAWIERIDPPAMTHPTPHPATRPATQPVKLTEVEIAALRAKAGKQIAAVRPYVLTANVTGRIDIENLAFFDPVIKVVYHPRNLIARVAVIRGQIEASYSTMISGGVINRRFAVNLADEQPTLAHQEQVKDVLAGEVIQPQLELFFPGNKVGGTFNRTADLHTPLVDILAAELDTQEAYRLRTSGSAVTITTNGVVSGRAAPMIVTRVFPGLNLTHYPYKKMTAFATFSPDGTASNDMIFDGQRYDMYMVGTTDADNVARYEVGLILLSAPQSPEFNHRLHTGRLAILKSTSLLIDGKRLNEEISYLWPNEQLFNMAVRDNSFYRLWLESRKPPRERSPKPEPEK